MFHTRCEEFNRGGATEFCGCAEFQKITPPMPRAVDLGVGRMAAHLTLRGSAFVYLVTRERQVNGGHLATGPWRAALGSVGSAQSRGPSLGGGEESGLPLGAQAPGRLLKPLVLSAPHPAPEASATHSSISLWAPGGAEVTGLHQAALPEAVLGRASTQALISQALVMISFTIS